MAEIPVQPKRQPEIPVEPRRRRSVWPWVVGLLALILLPFLFMRDSDDTTAAAPDTGALVDTTTRLGGQTTSAAGSIAPAADTANTQGRARVLVPGAASTLDTTARGDTAARTDTTTRR